MAAPKKQSPEFKSTFKKYEDMTDGEKASFKQGAITVSNRVQEQLGLRKSKD